MVKSESFSDLRFINETANQYDVVVVGAGPYGLSTAAHLLGDDLDVAIFGKPMQLWREYMPTGMLLRSFWWATTFSDPERQYGLKHYLREIGQRPIDPLPGKKIADYGLWFQENLVPNLDETFVQNIERSGERFLVTLSDGRLVTARVVVMAPGLRYYARRPTEYSHIRPDLISHSSEHHTLDRFAGKRLVIIGGGQSALETAALAHESGAHVDVISRSSIVWLEGSPTFNNKRALRERLLSPKASIAPGWFNWGLDHFPHAFQRLPRMAKDRVLRGIGSYGPAGASWLKPRVSGRATIHERLSVKQVQEIGDEVVLTLSNDEIVHADHVILATGYRVDVNRLPMLHSSLLARLRTYNDAPILNNSFESSVAGLYFVGFSSVSSCGPLYRFVAGTDAAARHITRSIQSKISTASKVSR